MVGHDSRRRGAAGEAAAAECPELPTGDITRILSQIEQGDDQAAEELLQLIYEQLRSMAAAKMAREKPGQTLQTTALVHEAYIRLVDQDRPQHWDSRRHFFAAAAEAMRRILVEQARRKSRLKHGGGKQRVELHADDVASEPSPFGMLALDEALGKMKSAEPAKAELVALRYFAGLSMLEAADVLGVSLRTAERYWTFAKSWLFAELSDHSTPTTWKMSDLP